MVLEDEKKKQTMQDSVSTSYTETWTDAAVLWLLHCRPYRALFTIWFNDQEFEKRSTDTSSTLSGGRVDRVPAWRI
jgi:hypothetical protein